MSIVDKFKNWPQQKQRKLLEELLMIHAGTDGTKLLYAKPEQLNVAWHDSAETIHRAYWDPVCQREDIPYEELFSRMSIEAGDNGLGDIVGNTPEQVLSGIRQQGCWAFTNYNDRTVHLWVGTAEQGMVMRMIMSEVAHLTPDRWTDEQLEELRVEQFGYVADIALQIFTQAMEQRAAKLEG